MRRLLILSCLLTLAALISLYALMPLVEWAALLCGLAIVTTGIVLLLVMGL